MLIILTVLVVAISGILILYFLHRRAGGEHIRAFLEQLAATMQIEDARIQRLPLKTLTGRYRTYQFIIECFPDKAGGKGVNHWRISTELARSAKNRLYLQGEAHESRLRKVLDLNLVATGDDLFDGRIMVFSSDGGYARRIFNPYLRHRFLWAGFSAFAMEINEKNALLELFLEPLANVRYVRHSMEVWAEFLNILENV